MKFTIPQVGQRIRCVVSDDNGTGGQGVVAGKHLGTVSKVEKLHNGWSIEIMLDRHANCPCPSDHLDDWSWGYHSDNGPETHPNGHDMGALASFHYHWEFVNGKYNPDSRQEEE